MSDERQTVAGAYAKIEAHEDLCAERYRRIDGTLSRLEDGQANHSKAAWGIVVALVAWMGMQLYNEHAKATPAPVTVVAAPVAGK